MNIIYCRISHYSIKVALVGLSRFLAYDNCHVYGSAGELGMKSKLFFWALLAVIALGVDASAQFGDILGKARKTVLSNKEKDKEPKQTEITPETVTSFTGPKKRLAVMDLDVKISGQSTMAPNMGGGYNTSSSISIPMPSDFGSGLTEMLTTALIKSNRFIVIERKAIQDLQSEAMLASSGMVNPDTAIKPGSLLGAQAMIRGAVTEYSYKKSSTGSGAVFGQTVGLQRNTLEAMVAIDVRIYDAATGQILDSVRADGKAKSSENTANVEVGNNKLSTSNFSSTPLGAASREAIEKAVKFICDRMELRPWAGAIAEIDGENDKITALYLNAGKRTGIKEGDEFEVFRAGRPIVNPETKVVIGRTKDTVLGRCKVESVEMDISIALPTEGTGFQRGDMIRFRQDGSAPSK
jgi:curli biogenesis system outer membrane secretion channel CsgG